MVRHAEVHNPKDIVYGRLPRFGLSDRGRRQAEAVARFLTQRPVDAVYTSPLLRARQTAGIVHTALNAAIPGIAGSSAGESVRTQNFVLTGPQARDRDNGGRVRLHRDSRLLEVRTGYQGRPNSILVRGFSFYEPLVHESDESMQNVLDRMTSFLRAAARKHAGRTIVGVSHADPIAILRLGLEEKELTVSNLHSVVYPERVSVNQIVLGPDKPPELTYFDVASSMTR